MSDKKGMTNQGLRCECGGPLGIKVYYKDMPTKHTVASPCNEFKPKA